MASQFSDEERERAIREKVAEKVERVAGKVAEHAARHERMAERAAAKAEALDRKVAKVVRHAEALERAAAQIGALELWTRPPPRARRPRFTREAIAQAAMRIADTEGFGAVSMRRLATELDAGTMTLYHYVRTKDELLSLLVDAVMGEVVIPDDEPMPDDWRAALTMVAERTRAALTRHPWIMDMTEDPAIGPNSVRHFDQSLQAVSSLPLELAERFDIVSAVDEYVFGYCLQFRNNRALAEPSHDAEMVRYVEGLVATGAYPQLAAIAGEEGLEPGWRRIEAHLRDPERFSRNLARLLDGIALSIPTDGG